jgi:hypothetical protein
MTDPKTDSKTTCNVYRDADDKPERMDVHTAYIKMGDPREKISRVFYASNYYKKRKFLRVAMESEGIY